MIYKTLNRLNKTITYLFVFALLYIFPFYMKMGYSNIGFAKWVFFRFLTLGTIRDGIYYPGLLLIATAIEITIIFIDIFNKRFKINFLKLDKLIIIYFIIAIISSLFAFNKWQSYFGIKDWWMGLFAQCGFVLTYYFVSRYFKPSRLLIYSFSLITLIVYTLEILNRFWIFIPRITVYGLLPRVIVKFVSTIGNINWYASYMAITMPICFVLSIFSKYKDIRIYSLLSILIISMSFVTQNSASLIVAMLVLLVVLLFISFKDKEYLKRYSLLVVMMLLGFKIICVLRILFPNRSAKLDNIFLFIINSNLTTILLIISLIICFVVFKYINNENIIYIKRIVKYIFYVSLILFIIFVLLINMNFINLNINLFKFNDSWGNNRGEIWRISLKALIQMFKENPFRIIIGAGSDNYYDAVYYYCFDEVKINWFNVILTNAHNEWLTALINYGLVGGLVYLCIYLKSIYYSFKKEDIYHLILGMMLLCYVVNNFFSFQQAVSTPIAFFVFALIDKELIDI